MNFNMQKQTQNKEKSCFFKKKKHSTYGRNKQNKMKRKQKNTHKKKQKISHIFQLYNERKDFLLIVFGTFS